MQRALAIVLTFAIAASWVTAFATPRTLPPCCKSHGCPMMKRVSARCAFSRCDQSDNALDAKKVLAVLFDGSQPAQDWASSRVVGPGALGATAILSAGIDHPPQLLLR